MTISEREAACAWPSFARFLPPARARDPKLGGRPRVKDEFVFMWVCWMLRSGCPWRHLPPGCPARTVRRRLAQWRTAGVFDAWALALRDAYLPAHGPCFMDATFVRARTSGEDVGLTRHGKGSKVQAIFDWRSMPVAWQLQAAGPGEGQTAQAWLPTLTPRERPAILVMDRAYRARGLHELCASLGIRFLRAPAVA